MRRRKFIFVVFFLMSAIGCSQKQEAPPPAVVEPPHPLDSEHMPVLEQNSVPPNPYFPESSNTPVVRVSPDPPKDSQGASSDVDLLPPLD